MGQIIFLIWNSINDPLFGYLFDRHLLVGAQCQGSHLKFLATISHSKVTKIKYFLIRIFYPSQKLTKQNIIRSKIKKIRLCGPALAISFYLFWSPLFSVGVNFIIDTGILKPKCIFVKMQKIQI